LDTEIGRVLQALEDSQVAGQTLVIFTSDNGGAKFLSRNLPLRGEKQLLFEGGIREPMILRWPGVLPEGATCSTPFIAMDLTATIAAAGGAKSRDAQPFDGIDMIPILTGKAKPDPERPIFFRRRTINVPENRNEIRQSAVRQGDWKLLRTYRPSSTAPYQSALYHLTDDIGETNNLIAEKPKQAKKLGDLLDQWENQMTATAEPFPTWKK